MADNTLGAPTEGLGQTVTFTAGQQRGTPQAQGGQRQGVRNSLQGGQAQGVAKATYIPTKEDPTLSLLHKMGSAILAPHIEAAQTAQYVKGMQQASEGQAIAEIVEDQPWYSKMFGSTSLVDGARAYSANAQVQNELRLLNEQMPELRSKSGGEMQAYVTKRIGDMRSGDSGTDTLVTGALLKELPGLLKTHSKEHLLYLNDNLSKAWADNATAASANFSSIMARGSDTDTAGEMLGAKVSYASSMAKPDTVPQPTYNTMLTNAAGKLANERNAHAFSALKDSGLFSQLDANQQDLLSRAEQQMHRDIVTNLPVALADQYAVVMARAHTARTPADLEWYQEQAVALNQRVMQATGTPLPLVPVDKQITTKAQILVSIEDATRREAEHNARLAEKEATTVAKVAAEDANLQNAKARLAAGAPPSAFKAELVEMVYSAAGNNTLSPEWIKLAVQTNAFKHTDAAGIGFVAQRMQDAISHPAEFFKTYQNVFKPMRELSEEAAIKYFGPDASAMMLKFASKLGKTPIEQVGPEILGVYHAQSIVPTQLSSPKDAKGATALTKDIVKAIQATDPTWFPKFLAGDNTPKDRAMQEFSDAVYTTIHNKVPGGVAAVGAVDTAMAMLASGANPVELVGGHVIRQPTGSPPLVKTLLDFRQAPDSLGRQVPKVLMGDQHKALDFAVDHFANQGNLQDFTVAQVAGSRAGVILIGNTNGKLNSRTIYADEIADLWANKDKVDPATESWMTLTPQITDKQLGEAYKKGIASGQLVERNLIK